MKKIASIVVPAIRRTPWTIWCCATVATKWYHYGCAGVTENVAKRKWFCVRCVKKVHVIGKSEANPTLREEVSAKDNKFAESCQNVEKQGAADSEAGSSKRTVVQDKPSPPQTAKSEAQDGAARRLRNYP